MKRSIRWLDRCVAAHARPTEQNLFAIIQGGLDPELRRTCVEEMVKRNTPGIAIGGLSGGEEKSLFWKTVSLCTDLLPKSKPRYLMGVGYAVDLVVCCALGVDMFDCVYPTRTARFGTALVPWGQLHLKHKQYVTDLKPIDRDCGCSTCKHHSRAYINSLLGREEVACHLITIHNIYYQMQLMRDIRESIKKDSFPEFVQGFMNKMFPDKSYPDWAQSALASVNIFLDTQQYDREQQTLLRRKHDLDRSSDEYVVNS